MRLYRILKIINIFKPVENIENLNHNPNNAQKAEFDFIYPASLMNHKNHKLLINALIKLSNKKIFPKVVLTLEKKDEKKLNIEKKNFLPEEGKLIIFPSSLYHSTTPFHSNKLYRHEINFDLLGPHNILR